MFLCRVYPKELYRITFSYRITWLEESLHTNNQELYQTGPKIDHNKDMPHHAIRSVVQHRSWVTNQKNLDFLGAHDFLFFPMTQIKQQHGKRKPTKAVLGEYKQLAEKL